MTAKRMLILGGTAEAAALTRAAADRFGAALDIITSLAGRTSNSGKLCGQVRIGGFGGVDGLTRYLLGHAIDLLIDATHPFAATISAHARRAADASAIPRLQLWRPAWPRHPLDRWIEVADMSGAAAAMARAGRRALVTVGAGELAAFAGLSQVWMLVRLIDAPASPPPLSNYELLLARGPFRAAGERRLMESYGIDVLVTKASGGEATSGKIEAARALNLPVVIVRRPLPEAGPRVEQIEDALGWIDEHLT